MMQRKLSRTIWWNPFTVERVSLTTSLTTDECIERLRANIYSFWRGTDQSVPFLGTARRHRFTVVKNTPHFRNAFRPFAYGVLRSDGGNGTVISIRLALALVTRVWWGVLLGGFVVVFLLSLLGVAGIFEVNRSLSQPFNVAIAAVSTGTLFYPLYVLGAFISRGERAFLITSVQQILHASVILP